MRPIAPAPGAVHRSPTAPDQLALVVYDGQRRLLAAQASRELAGSTGYEGLAARDLSQATEVDLCVLGPAACYAQSLWGFVRWRAAAVVELHITQCQSPERNARSWSGGWYLAAGC